MARSSKHTPAFDWVCIATALVVGFVIGWIVIHSPNSHFKDQVGGLALAGVSGVSLFWLLQKVAD